MLLPPVETRGLSRECVLRIPCVSSRNNRIKKGGPVLVLGRARIRSLRNVYGVGSPTAGSVPVDFLRPKFRVAHTKHDVISILMNEYTYINMYII